MNDMKSWIDTSVSRDNIWLVLVFHGVNDIGWEPKTGDELEEYFSYIKEKEDEIWVATFADVTKYIKERKNTTVKSKYKDDVIVINIYNDLNTKVYNVPVSMKTYVPKKWKSAILYEESAIEKSTALSVQNDSLGNFVLYDLVPETISISIREN
jgi:hypothetical protein